MLTLTAPSSPRVVSLTSNVPFPVQAGSWVTWTAVATSGSGVPLEYKFLRFDAGAGWTTVQDWSPNARFVWATAAMDFGTHYLQVWVRRVGSTAMYEAWLGTDSLIVNGPLPVTMVALLSSTTFPTRQGKTITWGAIAVGGYGPLQYKFIRYDAGSWQVVQDYSTSPTYSWTVGAADVGTHALQVWVRSVGSTASYDVYSGTGMFSILP